MNYWLDRVMSVLQEGWVNDEKLSIQLLSQRASFATSFRGRPQLGAEELLVLGAS